MNVALARQSAPESGVRRVGPLSPGPMSKRIWDLDWSAELPWALDGATVDCGTFADALPFVREHYPAIFGQTPDARFLVEEMTEAKRRFGEEMDVFVFRSGEKTVGICTAHPSDWSTWYIRTFAILPEFRERRFCSEFAQRLVEPLQRAGVTRWEADCSAANRAMVRLFTSQGLVATSMLNSERWGMTLRFTKFLREDAEEVFRRQFLNVPAFGRDVQPELRRTP